MYGLCKEIGYLYLIANNGPKKKIKSVKNSISKRNKKIT